MESSPEWARDRNICSKLPKRCYGEFFRNCSTIVKSFSTKCIFVPGTCDRWAADWRWFPVGWRRPSPCRPSSCSCSRWPRSGWGTLEFAHEIADSYFNISLGYSNQHSNQHRYNLLLKSNQALYHNDDIRLQGGLEDNLL